LDEFPEEGLLSDLDSEEFDFESADFDSDPLDAELASTLDEPDDAWREPLFA
jgi:hypothetical protein